MLAASRTDLKPIGKMLDGEWNKFRVGSITPRLSTLSVPVTTMGYIMLPSESVRTFKLEAFKTF